MSRATRGKNVRKLQHQANDSWECADAEVMGKDVEKARVARLNAFGTVPDAVGICDGNGVFISELKGTPRI